MDGTGELFSALLANFDGDAIVLPLPQFGAQDHVTLANIIKDQLPQKDYILLAESFAGAIIPELLKHKPTHVKGLIFVASFLSPPKQYLLSIAKYLPLKLLASLPYSTVFYKFLLLGSDASKTLLAQFNAVIKSIPEPLMKSRLAVMQRQQLPSTLFDIPAIYIRARSDKLISVHQAREFSHVFSHIKCIDIAGPHFILQAKPEESARRITEAMALFLSDSSYS